jgi:pyridoxine/pyridoxamine 5'-phosphate oxidase
VSGKITLLSPNQPDPPVKVHDGWGKSRRKITTSGDVLTELGRLYRRAAAGLMHPEDLKAAVWALRQMHDIAEKVVLERRIEELERKLAEAEKYAP